MTDLDPGVTEVGQNIDEFAAPNLSPEEYAEHTASMVANALTSTRLFEVVEVKAGIGQISLMGRVKSVDEKRFVQMVIDPALDAMEGMCKGFIGKQYLKKKKGDKTKYAWVLSIASNNLKEAASEVCSSFESACPKMEVMESPLVGKGPGSSVPVKLGGTGSRGAMAVRG